MKNFPGRFIAQALRQIFVSDILIEGWGARSQTIVAAAAIDIDLNNGPFVDINQTTNVAHTINIPTNRRTGTYLTIQFRNTSGGAAGAVTFTGGATGFRTGGAFTQPATGNNRKIVFYDNGTNLTEVMRGAADVAN